METPSQEVITLREEIGYQQAILASLQDLEDQESRTARRSCRREIQLLVGRLLQITSQTGTPSSSVQLPTGSQGVKTEPGYHRSTASPATPINLPSRKREFAHRGSPTSPTHQSTSKSRRTAAMTPVAKTEAMSPSNDIIDSDNLEIIDLTGDDVDHASSYIAAQIQQEKLAAQWQRDREIARNLFKQPAAPRQPAHHDPNDPRSNPLQRLMTNARTNGAPSYSSADQESSGLKVEYPGYGQIPRGAGRAMAALHDDKHSPAIRQALQLSQEENRRQAQMKNERNEQLYQELIQRRAQIQQWQQQQGIPPRHPHGVPGPFPPADMSWSAVLSQPPPVFGSTTRPNVPGNGSSSSMGDIINRTSNFLSSNLPGFGYPPMSDRMSHFLDMTAQDEKITDKELEELLQNIRPDIDIPLGERCDRVEGINPSLYHHQELALKWMQEMEEGTNKGGILADDMGLGKTISMLALMVSRRATTRPKTNLIIGPLSLIRQWESEIRSKTTSSHRFSVFIYHGKKTTIDELLTYDVVLTTYGTIATELKKLETFIKENTDRQIDYNDRITATRFPLLHPTKAKFYRVILDEAQCIKNKETQTAKACHRLRATYRWCLTGTPMMNGVLELFSLVAFLHIKPYCAWERFRQQFGVLFGKQGDEKTIAMTKLRALLKAIMLRRKKNSILDGKLIMPLPPKTEQIVYAQLSADERDFYNQLELKAQVQFNKYLREGSVGKNYSHILVLLLRLRQACCHPHLNLDVTDVTPVTPEQVLDLVKKLEPSIVARIKAAEAFECPICYDAVPSPAFFIPCGHDSCNQCLSRLSDTAQSMNLQEGTESDKAKCPVCRGAFDPRQCFTYEAFKSVHMPEAIKEAPEDEDDSDEDIEVVEDSDDSDAEPGHDDEVDEKGNLFNFVVPDGVDDHFFSDSDGENNVKPDVTKIKAESSSAATGVKGEQNEDEEEKEERRKAKIKQGKRAEVAAAPKKQPKTEKVKTKRRAGKKKEKEVRADIKPSMLKELRIQARKSREAYRKYMAYLRQTWLPAAKVTECVRLLKEAEEQGRQSIVFSQWTLLLDLIEVAIEHEDFKHKPQRYDGGMTGEERNSVATAFQDKKRKDVTIMLISLRAGNAGLNLTEATRVIIMDPFWNPYIEMQAVDRAYRIGQKEPVEVFRILTQDTVEDRIVELKDKKQAIVEAALDEAESAKIGRLGVSELKFLFKRRDE